MSGIRVCATDQGRFFTSKNPEQTPNFQVLLQNRPYFLKFYSRTGSFFDNLVSNALAQMSKIPVAFLKVTGFLFKKYACLLPVIIIICKLYSNKLMLPVKAFVSCSLIFISVLLYLSKVFQAFYNWDQFQSGHMYSSLNLT